MNPKMSKMYEIQETLGIGVDKLVFMDHSTIDTLYDFCKMHAGYKPERVNLVPQHLFDFD